MNFIDQANIEIDLLEFFSTYGENKLQMCSMHERVNEYYCNEEELAFCTACVAQGLHKDHSVMTLGDKVCN